MSKVESILKRIDAINKWMENLSAVLIVGLTFVVMFEVFMRYIFSKPQIWTSQTALMIYGVIGVLAGGYVLLQKGHIRVDVVLNMMKGRKRSAAEILADIFVVISAGALLWKGIGFTWDSVSTLEMTGGVFNVPLYPVKIIMLLGIVLLLLQGIAAIVRDTADLIKPQASQESTVKAENNAN